MKNFLFALPIYIVFFTCKCHAQLIVDGYTNYNLAGFTVLVENEALDESTVDESYTEQAINLLELKLLEILEFNIDQEIKDSLKAVPFFIDWNTTSGAAVYHPGEAWLITNGYLAEKARGIEISNLVNFVEWTHQNQPYMVLHELAHAYHHRVLNFNSSIITHAFTTAVNQNLYTNVSYHVGNESYFTQEFAYALNSEIEYFAEITEAYFGLNDYFPFTYPDLYNYDLIGFNALVSIWGEYSPVVGIQSSDKEVEKTLLKTIDILGRTSYSESETFLIDLYSDGTSRKRVVLH